MASADDRTRFPADAAARLARTARHDLRGALNALHLHVELLLGTDEDGSSDARQRRAEHAAVVRDACRSLCALLPLAVEPLPPPRDAGDAIGLDALVTGVAERLRPIADARGVTLEAEAQGALRVGGPAAERSRAKLVCAVLDALETAPRGCTIRIALDPAARRVRVTSSAGGSSDVDLGSGDA